MLRTILFPASLLYPCISSSITHCPPLIHTNNTSHHGTSMGITMPPLFMSKIYNGHPGYFLFVPEDDTERQGSSTFAHHRYRFG
ncbi:hypothetical protein EYC80_004330 [Monilinia laxa]|uniref:Secreted protein n=1 Tax=Monilinia laxa TaxID=61186 RepID=A0A5N6KMU8_MONLA|nr:hypothetical protein EYC80_004330 [Monilinia laxa]